MANIDHAVPGAELDARVIELKRTGLSFQQIGDQLGYSRSQMHRCFQRGLSRIVEPEVTAIRAEHRARLALAREAVLDVLAAHHVVVSNGHIVSAIVGTHPERTEDGATHPNAGAPIYGDPLIDSAPVLAAVDRLLKIDDQELRLVGGYPAAKLELGGHVNYTVGGGVDPASLT